MQTLAEQVIIDILKHEFPIATENIWIRSQNKKIPNNDDLYIVVGMSDSRGMSSCTDMEQRLKINDPPPNTFEQVEINSVNMLEFIQIDIVSKTNEAILRRWEIPAALRSIYAQQKQESNYFKIFRIPISFINASGAEGGSQLNRYTMTIPCFVWYKKEKVLDPDGGNYYDDFRTRVDDEKTIGTEHGIFEFEISAEE